MAFAPVPKRPLKSVGNKIWDAISVMEERYGGQLTHDSGHGKDVNDKATTWIYTFPEFGDAQIAVPMNRGKLSLLMRGTTLDGCALKDVVGDLAVVAQTYVDPNKGVASSVLGPRAPFLNPGPTNPLLRVIPHPGSMDALLALYLAAARGAVSGALLDAGDLPEPAAGRGSRRVVTADELQRQLNRNTETGNAGELIAVKDELERLRKARCPEPNLYVKRVALTDVGRGYDLESTWPGHERCIEVKSTSRAGSDFFVTENERQVLSALGNRAWLYRVVVGADGGGAVMSRLQDPINRIDQEHVIPVVWRVAGEALAS